MYTCESMKRFSAEKVEFTELVQGGGGGVFTVVRVAMFEKICSNITPSHHQTCFVVPNPATSRTFPLIWGRR